MKKLMLAAYILFFCSVSLSFASNLETYKKHFEKKMEEFFWSNADETKKLNAGYEKALDNLKAKAVSDGNLDLIEAVMNEKKRLARERTVSEEEVKDDFEELGKLQKMYIEARLKLKLGWAKDVLSLAKEYDKALKNLQVTLTRQEDLPGARAVREERRKIKDIKELVEAREFIDNLGPDQRKAYAELTGDNMLKKGKLPASLKEGLVLYYSFERNESGKVTDQSGNDHHGKVYGAKWNIKGKAIGGCYEFDGRDDWINIDDGKYGDGQKFALTAWFKHSHNSDKDAIITFNPRFAGGQTAVSIMTKNTGSLSVFHWGRPQNTFVFKEVDYPADQWTHVVLCFDGSYFELYLNGVSQGTEPEGRYINQALGTQSIGRLYDDRMYFKGSIDQVRIYNRALSKQEVLQLYNAEK